MPTDVQRIQAVFLAAAKIADPANRARFLDGVCDGNAELRSRVEALLRAHDQPDSLLDHPAVAAPDPDHGATQALTGTPDPGVAVGQTTGGDNGASDDEALTFLAPPTRPDALGRIGHYEVLQVLGRGGFGIVFRAFDQVLQRVVALKVMAPQLAATSPARRRFLREARSSAQVRHENVVQVYEVAEQPLPYLAMEFIPGETLQQWLDRIGPVEPAEVVRVGRQIAEGLAAAHATDLIHRDIKPGNVLLEGGHQKVKITDFGLARAADDASISQSGIIAGTPMYMAPEQALGHKLDQRADLFSLGSVLYQMVAGRPPFRANGTLAVLKRVAEDTPRDIREIIPEAPQWLCDIIAKLHVKDPDDRYQSAREVADVLADCEAQLKANAKLKDYSRISRGKPRRSGRWAGWVATVVLLAVIGVALGWWRGWVNKFFAAPSPVADSGASSGTPNAASPPVLAVAPFDAAKAKDLQEVCAKQLGVPVEVTDIAGMKMRLIPPGEFLMGTPEADLPALLKDPECATGAYWRRVVENESPPQRVRLTRPYRIGATEVTRGQFRRFVQATGYKTDVERGVCQGLGLAAGQKVRDAKFTWDAEVGLSSDDNTPVVNVSWYDAQQFCAWLSSVTGRTYRLPTEAEWEFACRAGTDTSYYTGEGEDALKVSGWYARNCDRLHSVGQLAANPWGLYDMHGNVWEWCQDCYADAAYRSGLFIDPTNRPGRGVVVRRGGGWWSVSIHNRSATRDPVGEDANVTLEQGFRVVMVGELTPGASTPAPAAKQAPLPPFTDADVQRIAALPAEEQVEEVRKELVRRNPGFDGKVETKIEDGVVTEFRIATDQVRDIAPIRVFNALRVLECRGSYTDKPNGLLADLTPLEGTNLAGLTHLDLHDTNVTDAGMVYFKDCKDLTFLYLTGTKLTDRGLAHFNDCKNLTFLSLGGTGVSDAGLIHFRDCKGLTYLNLGGTKATDVGMAHFQDCNDLTQLDLGGTKVSDAGLTNFKRVPLVSLWIYRTGITDLTSLQGMPLEEIRLTPKNITKGLDILRDMKSLKTIGIESNQAWAAAEFWRRYDKREFKE